jgi:hypothetical protein
MIVRVPHHELLREVLLVSEFAATWLVAPASLKLLIDGG